MRAREAALFLACVLLACEMTQQNVQSEADRDVEQKAVPTPSAPKHVTYEELLAAPEEKLAQIDIAEMNLAVATSLPGAEGLDVGANLRLLNTWTRAVRAETERNLHRFYRQPSEYNDSLAYFKILLMVTVLQQDFGASYNMELVRSGVMQDVTSTRFFRNAKDLFIHGILSSRHSGSCASLPVLVVAVGRRLGYPLNLVGAKGHLFARWEDKNERFNIEAAGRGLNVHPDSYYRTWPHPITEEEIAVEGFLDSSTPAATLADFLYTRALCLKEYGRYREALEAFDKAVELRPKSVFLRRARQRLLTRVRHLEAAALSPAPAPAIPDHPALPTDRRLSPAEQVRLINEFNGRNRPQFGVGAPP